MPRLFLCFALALVVAGSVTGATGATTPGANGRLVFTRMLGVDHMQLFTSRVDGSDERRLAPSDGNQEFAAWSPNGAKVAFWRSDSRCRFQCGTVGELVVANADGSGVQVVARDAREPGTDWSPDGTHLVYVASGSGGSDLFITNLDGTNRQLLVSLPGGEGVPSWSPDGRRIAFASQESNAVRQLYVVDADGSNLRRLTHTAAINSDPDWSPDGRLLAWVSGEPRADVYLMRPDGSGVRRLTFDGYSADPSWSPDGSQIAYGSAADIYTVSIVGGQPRRVTATPEWEGFPDWQPLSDRAADLVVFQRASATLAKPRARIFMNVLVHNDGPGRAVGVALTDVVRSGTVVAVEPEKGDCVVGNVVMCALGGIEPGGSVRVRLILRAPRAGRLVNVATVTGETVDVVRSNNRAVAAVPVKSRRR